MGALDDAFAPLEREAAERDAEEAARKGEAKKPEAPATTATESDVTSASAEEVTTREGGGQMAELEEMLERLLQPVHKRLEELHTDMASRVAAVEDACRLELSKLQRQVADFASAAGTSRPDPEMVGFVVERMKSDFGQRVRDDENLAKAWLESEIDRYCNKEGLSQLSPQEKQAVIEAADKEVE